MEKMKKWRGMAAEERGLGKEKGEDGKGPKVARNELFSSSFVFILFFAFPSFIYYL